ncbi:hypothetical protein Hanom_Chr10g00914901 [Helianthus anomalus]
MWGLGIFVVFELGVFVVFELGGFILRWVVVVIGYGFVTWKRETSGDSWSPEVGGGDRRSWWPERG